MSYIKSSRSGTWIQKRIQVFIKVEIIHVFVLFILKGIRFLKDDLGLLTLRAKVHVFEMGGTVIFLWKQQPAAG